MSNPFRYFNSSPEVIRLVVMMYVKYPLSLRNVEDLLAERGIDISHETVRFWWNRFGPMFAAEIRKKRVAHMRRYPQWRWHLDEVFVKVNGKLCYLWRAVDHEGEVLEAVVTAKRDKAAALKLLKRIVKRYGRPRKIVTDGLCSYPAAMKEIGNADRHEVGRRLNNRAENSHQPFRRRERAMQRFRSMKTPCRYSDKTTCGASPRSTPSTSPAWRMCSTSMPSSLSRSGQWSASTKASKVGRLGVLGRHDADRELGRRAIVRAVERDRCDRPAAKSFLGPFAQSFAGALDHCRHPVG